MMNLNWDNIALVPSHEEDQTEQQGGRGGQGRRESEKKKGVRRI